MSTPPSPSAAWLVLLVLAATAWGADDAAQRQRIERERAAVEAQARAGERACAERFAVSACLAQVRSERRAALEQLDRQRALLDDAERKRRAAERQARIQQRQEAQARQDEERRPPAAARTAPARPAETAPSAAQDGAPPAPARSASPADAAAARRAQGSRQRATQAEAHREAVERRNLERAVTKPQSPSLPVPAASGVAR